MDSLDDTVSTDPSQPAFSLARQQRRVSRRGRRHRRADRRLLVGDALRGSLRQLTIDRLGWVESALVGPRLIRESVAAELSADLVSPALVVRATVHAAKNDPPIRHVQLIGVDARFWNGRPPGGILFNWGDNVESLLINAALADKADVSA